MSQRAGESNTNIRTNTQIQEQECVLVFLKLTDFSLPSERAPWDIRGKKYGQSKRERDEY